MASENAVPSTVIVGAGIFGTSTAYHLSKVVPPESITIIDRHPFPSPWADSNDAPYGASHDINKIVRADYSSPFYMQLAQEAIEQWQTLDLIKPFYYRTGWAMLDEEGSDLAERIRSNFKTYGVHDETRDMTFEEVKQSWGGVMKDVDTQGFGSAYWNPGAGWAEADRAVEAMLADAVSRGVHYKQGKVVDLHAEGRAADADQSDHRISGVRLDDNTVIHAGRVVLATGAWTSSLMNNVENKLNLAEKDRVESQVKAAGVTAVHFELDEEEKARFDKMPVIVYGGNGEILPPPPNRLLKFTNAASFTNNIDYDGRAISTPVSAQRDVPEILKTETIELVRRQIPSMLQLGHRIAFWRTCWDAITPQQHQLITRHPDERLSTLFLATGGSFHSWKFLPTMGKYIANAVQGISNGEERDRNWAWKDGVWGKNEEKYSPQRDLSDLKTGEQGAHEKVIPKRDLKDLT